MAKTPACDFSYAQDEVRDDPREALTVLLDELSDQASQVVLEYLREWLRTTPPQS